jgi:Ca2+-binding RTX toxin-like protein
VPIPAGDDAIVFGEGISASDLSVSRAGDDLLIQIRNSSPKSPDHDSILIRNWNDPAQRIETIQFSDGSTMSSDDLSTLAMTGTDGADAIVAWSDATTVNALSGDDYITSQTPNASIYGGDGNDTIYTTGGNTSVDAGDGDDVLVDTGVDGAQLNGGAGNDDVTFSAAANYAIAGGQGDDHIHVADQFGSNGNFANVIEGGAGNDTIESGASADTYVFSRGDGADTVNDFAGVQGKGVTAGDDMLRFQGDVSYDQIWLQHVGDDLKVSLIGGSDSVTVQNWYADTRNQIETISTGDGYSIAAGQVDALVQAMASFTPPADGQSTLPDDYRTSLAPTLAASWAPPTGP